MDCNRLVSTFISSGKINTSSSGSTLRQRDYVKNKPETLTRLIKSICQKMLSKADFVFRPQTSLMDSSILLQCTISKARYFLKVFNETWHNRGSYFANVFAFDNYSWLRVGALLWMCTINGVICEVKVWLVVQICNSCVVGVHNHSNTTSLWRIAVTGDWQICISAILIYRILRLEWNTTRWYDS